MSKKIIIPLCRNPFDIYVNHHFYSYPAGEEVEVPDEVAEVIEQHIGCHVTDSAPPAPSGGGGNNNFDELLDETATDLYWDDITELESGMSEAIVEIIKNRTITTARFPALKMIPAYMFSNQGSLTSVDVSAATDIGGSAFTKCINLTNIDMPEATIIMANAFDGCTNLALTELPPKLMRIVGYAFANCSSLAITHFPASVAGIVGYAFNNCVGLTSITFEGTPSSIAASSFSGCTNLTTINVPWADGAVKNAPWGATNATINYNYKGD